MSRDRSRLGVWLSGATLLRLALAAAGMAAFGAYIWWSRDTLSAEARGAVWIAALILPVGALRVPLTTFRAGLKLELELLVTLLARSANLLAVLAVVRWQGSLTHLFATVLMTRALLGVLSWFWSYRAFRPKLAIERSAIRHLVRESIPMALSGLFVVAQLKLDIILVSVMMGASAGGLYAVVAQLPEYFLYIPVILTTPMLPLLSRFFADSDRERFQSMYQKLFDVLMAIVLPVAVAASLLSETVVRMLFGDAYLGSAPVLPLLMASVVFMWFSHAVAIAAVATGLQRHFIWIQMVCATIYLGLDLLFIPRFGLAGAAWARLAATVVAPLLTVAVVSRSCGFGLAWWSALRVGAASVALGGVIAILSPVSVTVSLVLGFLVYLGGLRLIGVAPWTIPRQLEGRI